MNTTLRIILEIFNGVLSEIKGKKGEPFLFKVQSKLRIFLLYSIMHIQTGSWPNNSNAITKGSTLALF